MKHAFVIVILILVPGLAHSQTEAYRFTPVADKIAELDYSQRPLLNRLSQAVVLLNSPTGRCTGTYISSIGHILTARHCLQICLIRSGVFHTVVEQGVIPYYELDPDKLGKSTCEVEINGVAQTVTVEATSPGMILGFDVLGMSSLNPALMKQLEANGFTSRGDFAIIRQQGVTAHPCMPLARDGARPGDFIQAIEYPAQTTRVDGHNSDGEQAYASGGRVNKSILENSCIAEANADANRQARFVSTFDESTAFISGLDSMHGASGSAAVNVRGEIVGVLINIYRHTALTQRPEDEPERRFCDGSSKALRIESILQWAQSAPSLLKELRCPQ